MKKNWKTWIAGGAALTLLVGVLSLPTLAASGSRIAQLDYANMKGLNDAKLKERLMEKWMY